MEPSLFMRLVDVKSAQEKEREFFKLLNEKKYYQSNMNIFNNVPGASIVYWASNCYFKIFEKSKELIEYAEPKQGLATGKNDIFIRQWYEVNINTAQLNSASVSESKNSNLKWFPYNKGGELYN